MERIFKSLFGLGFWRRKHEKQKKIEHEQVKRNLVIASGCLSSRHYNPHFAGNRVFTQHHLVTGR